MRRKKLRLVLFAMVLALVGTAMLQGREAGKPKPSEKPVLLSPDHLITKNSAGPVRLGMTVAQARKALPKQKFSRTADGEGLALIEVKSGETLEMILYAGEDNAESPINEKARVQAISVFGERYMTAEGVHPGMPLRDVEKKYGKLTGISMSEIEMREYAEFSKKPASMLLKVGLPEIGIAGKYAEGKRETKTYFPSAVVTDIEISENTSGN
jgi:hypothetical protein